MVPLRGCRRKVEQSGGAFTGQLLLINRDPVYFNETSLLWLNVKDCAIHIIREGINGDFGDDYFLDVLFFFIGLLCNYKVNKQKKNLCKYITYKNKA